MTWGSVASIAVDTVKESNERKEQLALTEKKIMEGPKFSRARNNGKYKLYNDNFINSSLHLFNRSLNYRHQVFNSAIRQKQAEKMK